MYPIKSSTALTIPFFVHDVAGDAVTSLTNGSFTKRISKNGAAFGAMTVTITELENGWYSIPLSTSHSDTLGLLTITFTNGGAKQVNLQFRVHARIPDDLAFPNTSGRGMDIDATGGAEITVNQDVNVAQWNGSNVAAPTVAGVPEVDMTHMVGGTQTVTDLKDFADAGYDPATNKVQGVVLVDTTTANTDMRGTDSAALASEVTAARMSELDAGTAGKMANQVDIIQTDTTTDIPATITTLQSDTSSILTDTGTTIPGTITTLQADTDDIQSSLSSNLPDVLSLANINSEVDTALATTTYAEPAQGTPGANISIEEKISFIYKFMRNRVTSTATEISVFNDNAITVDHKSTHSDDATTYDRGEFTTGP